MVWYADLPTVGKGHDGSGLLYEHNEAMSVHVFILIKFQFTICFGLKFTLMNLQSDEDSNFRCFKTCTKEMAHLALVKH